jgi:Lon protease-like protein
MSQRGDDRSSVLPMFPLGSPLLPSMLLPLRLFEPRYLAFARDVMDGDRRFGVVIIERGSEVGGGDVRAGVGCRAEVLEATELADGRWALVCVGIERIRVTSWLDDAPYPRAMVESWPDPDADGPVEGFDALLAQFHAVVSLAGELDPALSPLAGGGGLELSDDHALAVYQMAVASPLGSFDRHRVLCASDLATRVGVLAELLDDAAVLLRAQLDET